MHNTRAWAKTIYVLLRWHLIKFAHKCTKLFIIKIVHEVQQEKLKYTKETEQYTAQRCQSLSTNAINSSGNLISIKQVSAQIRIVSKEQHNTNIIII